LAKILVVDDDVSILRLIEFSLTRAGHTVNTARDGDEGLELAYSEPPDLAIVDIMMPRMNGYEFCRRIRQDPRTERTPILILSARSQQIDREASLAAGATDFMAKPVPPAEIVVRVEEMLAAVPALQRGAGRVLACFSLRGGAGVTSLAVNLAVALAFARRQEVPLLDLVPLGGHAALMLNLSAKRGWAELLSTGDHMTAKQLEPYLPRHSSGVRVLASPLTPSWTRTLGVEQLHNLLKALRRSFNCIVLDLPPLLSELTAAALTGADRILLVVTPDVAATQSTTIALDAMAQMSIRDEKVMIVLNQVFTQGALEPQAVQTSIKRPLAAVIPYASDMAQSINSGKPLLLSQPNSVAASAIAQLAAKATKGLW
jgi:pilus assembly protein CpaE